MEYMTPRMGLLSVVAHRGLSEIAWNTSQSYSLPWCEGEEHAKAYSHKSLTEGSFEGVNAPALPTCVLGGAPYPWNLLERMKL